MGSGVGLESWAGRKIKKWPLGLEMIHFRNVNLMCSKLVRSLIDLPSGLLSEPATPGVDKRTLEPLPRLALGILPSWTAVFLEVARSTWVVWNHLIPGSIITCASTGQLVISVCRR